MFFGVGSNGAYVRNENIPLWNQSWLSNGGRISSVSQQELTWPHIILSELLALHGKK